MEETILGMLLAAALLFFVALLFGVVFALPVMLLWNWVIPGLLGLPQIGLLKAWGLLVLCSLLFKSSK